MPHRPRIQWRVEDVHHLLGYQETQSAGGTGRGWREEVGHAQARWSAILLPIDAWIGGVHGTRTGEDGGCRGCPLRTTRPQGWAAEGRKEGRAASGRTGAGGAIAVGGNFTLHLQWRGVLPVRGQHPATPPFPPPPGRETLLQCRRRANAPEQSSLSTLALPRAPSSSAAGTCSLLASSPSTTRARSQIRPSETQFASVVQPLPVGSREVSYGLIVSINEYVSTRSIGMGVIQNIIKMKRLPLPFNVNVHD